MLRADRAALVCDLAETYGVLDYRSLPAQLVATLAAGLGDDSRSKRSLTNRSATRSETLLAAAVDRLSRIAWLLSFVCPHQGEPPKSVLRAILGEEKNAASMDVQVYASAEDFDAEWQRRTEESNGSTEQSGNRLCAGYSIYGRRSTEGKKLF